VSGPPHGVTAAREVRAASDVPFLACVAALAGAYALLIVAMLAADVLYTSPAHILRALQTPEIRHSATVSLVSCTLSALLSLWVGVPAGYLLARFRFPGKRFVDAVFDVPIVLPPLVVGVSLLILFRSAPGRALEQVVPITYEFPAVVLAQFAVAAAFAVRTMRAAFEQIDVRGEQVAMTLGCSRGQAFLRVTLPEAWRGVITAGSLAWARSLGEFGPVLVFASATRMKTEVLPTSVFLELSVGDVEAALAVSLLMVVLATAVLVVARAVGGRIGGSFWRPA